NNPLLMAYYGRLGLVGPDDRVVYNGAAETTVSNLDRAAGLDKYGLTGAVRYLVFTGSATKWHGVDCLAKLQQLFDENSDGVKIICGGGKVNSEYDPQGRLINIAPLSDVDCSDLIKVAHACL